MTTAQTIAAALNAETWTAYTLAYGYASNQSAGRILRFEPARIVEEKRTPAGRCARMVGEYADGSRLIFTWSEDRGSSVHAC